MATYPEPEGTGSSFPGSTRSPRVLSRRSFLRATGLVLAGAALSSCSPVGPRPAPRTSEKVQLVYQDARTDWFPPMVQEMLEQFHATHPNIRVFYTPEPETPKEREEKMLAEMRAGTAPDVFQGCCDWFPIWAQNGYLLDLRPFVSADLDKDTIEDWDQAQYRAFFTSDGQQYALPKFHGALALYYNKDVFQRYGVEFPDSSWDHDDYLAAMKRLTHDTNGDGKTDLWGSMTYVSWDRIQMHVNGWGGNLVDPKDPRISRMGEQPALSALEWLRARTWDDRVMPTYVDIQRAWPNDAFAAGRIAMVEDGSWNLKEILSKSKFKIGVAPFPAGPVRRVTLTSNDGFGIYSGTRHPEAAWELMKFLISKDYGRAMARANFLQPARASLVEDWAGFIRDEHPIETRDMDIEAFADGHIKGYSVTVEVANNMSEATRLANEAWDKILTLGQVPTDSMKGVAQRIQEAQSVAGGGRPCPTC